MMTYMPSPIGMHSSSWHRTRNGVALIGPPYGATHAEAQTYSSRTDAAEAAPIPYLREYCSKAFKCRDFFLGKSSL